ALTRAYDRLPEAPRPGYSTEKIGFVISLNDDGTVASVTDLREGEKKRRPRMMQVPQPIKRTVAIAPNLLWDKTPYALGVTAGESRRTAEEHAKFKERHADLLSHCDDAGLQALRLFLENWTPEQFIPPLWPNDMKDQNVVFALESERRQGRYLHDRPAARALVAERTEDTGREGTAVCLVTGEPG